MLENLTDETCERLNLALNDVVPVKQRLYRDTSIFQEADADKVSKVFWDCLTNHATPFCIFAVSL